MVGCAVVMLGLVLWGWLRWRGRLYDTPLFLDLAKLAAPLGFVAVIAGWCVTAPFPRSVTLIAASDGPASKPVSSTWSPASVSQRGLLVVRARELARLRSDRRKVESTVSSLRAVMRAAAMLLLSVSVYRQERPIHAWEDSPKKEGSPWLSLRVCPDTEERPLSKARTKATMAAQSHSRPGLPITRLPLVRALAENYWLRLLRGVAARACNSFA